MVSVTCMTNCVVIEQHMGCTIYSPNPKVSLTEDSAHVHIHNAAKLMVCGTDM